MEVQTGAGDKGMSRALKVPVWHGPALPASLAHAGGFPKGARAPRVSDRRWPGAELHNGVLPSARPASARFWVVREEMHRPSAQASACQQGMMADKDGSLSAV